ncbi:MAG: class I SAM-dependent methyltransferase [Rhodospirillaceae bacterium]|nr:class I SAM-dependent methyltransferase [Rhodospirillaceae bacterium]
MAITATGYATWRQEAAEHYGADAAKDAAGVVKFARKYDAKTVLDFGCGKGTLKPAIAAAAPDLTIFEFDPAIPGKETLPTAQIDVIAAMDVMEHIEPEYLDSVLETMRDMRPKLVILKIALTPAQKTLPDGRNAHILLKPAAWWMEQLQRYFTPRNAQELPLHFMFIGTPVPS